MFGHCDGSFPAIDEHHRYGVRLDLDDAIALPDGYRLPPFEAETVSQGLWYFDPTFRINSGIHAALIPVSVSPVSQSYGNAGLVQGPLQFGDGDLVKVEDARGEPGIGISVAEVQRCLPHRTQSRARSLILRLSGSIQSRIPPLFRLDPWT